MAKFWQPPDLIDQSRLRSTFAHQSQQTLYKSTRIPRGASLEVTYEPMIFLDGADLPIHAGKVYKVGDSLMGAYTGRTVTKITALTRGGYYNALASDGMLVVDGILVSSASDAYMKEILPFGGFSIRWHTELSRVLGLRIMLFAAKFQAEDGRFNIWCTYLKKMNLNLFHGYPTVSIVDQWKWAWPAGESSHP